MTLLVLNVLHARVAEVRIASRCWGGQVVY